MMKVAVVGATGNAGSRVLNELLDRGHIVTAIVRRPERVEMHERVTAVRAGNTAEALSKAIARHDAVISSVRFIDLAPATLVSAVRESGVRRFLIVGGAGSLMHPDGVVEAMRPEFPEQGRPNSLLGIDYLNLLRVTNDLDWTFISPPRHLKAGERTGVFRYGKHDMLMNAAGHPTAISYEDFALALVDELEMPKHLRERFTVGY